jgi:diguanylate cyclase
VAGLADAPIRAPAPLPVASGKTLEEQFESLGRSNLRLARQLKRLKQAIAAARFTAGHDPLTGLANRNLLFDRLEYACIRAVRTRKRVALLLLDLDGFKTVNDRYGHAVGDELLRNVAVRLGDCVRGGDTICRYGGDEFVIVLPDVDPAQATATAELVARKVRACLAVPYVIDGRVLNISTSVGAAVYRSAKQSGSELLRQADAAMYRDKHTRACV